MRAKARAPASCRGHGNGPGRRGEDGSGRTEFANAGRGGAGAIRRKAASRRPRATRAQSPDSAPNPQGCACRRASCNGPGRGNHGTSACLRTCSRQAPVTISRAWAALRRTFGQVSDHSGRGRERRLRRAGSRWTLRTFAMEPEIESRDKIQTGQHSGFGKRFASFMMLSHSGHSAAKLATAH